MKNIRKDILIIGLALFGSYFGAGNLIFPPLLGLISGQDWGIGAAAFIVSAVFLPVLALYVISYCGGSVEKLTKKLHPNFFKALLLVIMLMASSVSVPRTGAVGYELGLAAVFPEFPMPLFIILYFGIAFYFSIDVNEMINRVGRYLTPVLVILLIGIIIKGVLTPIGSPAPAKESGMLIQNFLGGYQTGDLIVSYLLGTVFIGDIIRRGYHSDKDRNVVVAGAGVIAFLLLCIIYVGLLYLGAGAGSKFHADIERSELLIGIAQHLLGSGGLAILGTAVFLACLTTAIGQITSIAAFFHEFTKGRISHKQAAAFFSVLGASIALLGVERIVFITTPIFLAIYPSLIVLTVLGLLFKNSLSKACYRCTVAFTLAVSLPEAFVSLFKVQPVIDVLHRIPLSEHGFAWVVPAIIGFVLGKVIQYIEHDITKRKGEQLCNITE